GEVRVERPHHRAEGDVAAPQGGLELLRVAHRQRGRGASQLLLRRGLEAAPPHLARQDLLAELEALLVLLLLDPLSDLVAGTGGLHVGKPVARRLRLRARQGLAGVAVLPGAVQRGDAPVDARALAVPAPPRAHPGRPRGRGCRPPPCGACRGCGSGSRTAARPARTPSCAATGSRSTWDSRCSP